MYMGPKKMQIVDVPDINPKMKEVKIAPKYVGICGSDVHGFLGITGRRTPPMIMGHEVSGLVLEVGSSVTEFKPGDRVTIQPILNCGYCEYCEKGLINICPNRNFLGTMEENGALVDSICVDKKNVILLPNGIDTIEGAMIEPLAVAYRAINQAMPIEGKTVMISGAGTIGLMILMLARYYNAGKTIILDLNNSRLDLARQIGADITINPSTQDIEEKLGEYNCLNTVDITIEAVGVTSTAQQTVDYVRNKGTVIWVGNSAQMITINMQSIVTREITIKGTYVYNEQDFLESIQLLAAKSIDVKQLISMIIPLEKASEMFNSLSSNAGDLIKVIIEL